MIPVHKNTEKLNQHTAYSIYIEIAYFEIPLEIKINKLFLPLIFFELI